jgi:hypothetical protein
MTPEGQSFRDILSPRQVDRFWRSVNQMPGACWEWRGRVQNGYGRFVARTSALTLYTHRAHRVAWELLRGPVPAGLQLDHLCRNTTCVNPDHLEPVTSWENTLRGSSPQAVAIKTNRCLRGHEFSAENTSVVVRDGRSHRRCKACAALIGAAWKVAKRARAEAAR